ncbi:MAG: GldG family protein [Candidatus Desulfofervidaceae bacterium]|nr:GldG family protein [Candidatus Desulfofervidaceae bacterium]
MKNFTYPVQLVLFTLIFLGILIFVNLFAQEYHKRFDFTTNKRYSLSPQSIKVLKHLDREVNVIGFFTSGAEKNKAKDLLEQYAYYSKKFHFTFIDPDRHPLEARKYNITRYNTLVVKCGEKREQVYETSEEKLTNAIVRVTRKEKKTIYFLSGHGEHDLNDTGKNGYSAFKTALKEKGFEVKTLLLVKESKVPDDAALIVVAGPQKKLMPAEIKLLNAYLEKGGRLLLLLDPETGQELNTFLEAKGVVLQDDIIVDKMSRLFGGDYLVPVIVKYNSHHPVTKDFKLACFLPLARSVVVKKSLSEKIKAEVLAWTSKNSWGETDLKTLKEGKATYDTQDIGGPVPVAVAAWSSNDKDKKGFKMIVVGDADFVSNTYLQVSGNQDLALNLISWLTEEQDLIAIPPKKVETTPLALSRRQAELVFWLPVVILPLSIIGVGIGVYLRRRRL